MVALVVIALVIIVAIIVAVASSKKDDKIALGLKSYLGSTGFITNGEIEVFDKDNQGKPFRFLIDRCNKKWTLANYRATMANVYDYSDLIDYSVTYRTMGTDTIKGEEFTLTASERQNSNCGIIESCQLNGDNCEYIESCQLNGDNCEYIEIRTVYGGQAKRNSICSYFILFEKQQTFLNAQNNDFHVPSLCVNNAKIFENMLYEIVTENRK